jgi:magnesium-transporting ATPase (P-type)
MISAIIWWLGLALLALILLRGFHERILGKYRLFYSQAAFVLVSFTLLYVSYEHQTGYAQEYWFAQFLTMLIASSVILEILKHVLFPAESSRRVARVIQGVLFLAIVCFAVTYVVFRLKGSTTEELLINLERGFRTVQALLLLAMGSVIGYLRIPLNKNLKGMFIGYSFYIGASLIILALRLYVGPRLDRTWDIVQPLSYDASLVAWLAGLWSYSPPGPAPRNTEMETKSGEAGIIALPWMRDLSH